MEPRKNAYPKPELLNLVYGSVLPDTQNEMYQSRVKDTLISSSKGCNSFAYHGVYVSS